MCAEWLQGTGASLLSLDCYDYCCCEYYYCCCCCCCCCCYSSILFVCVFTEIQSHDQVHMRACTHTCTPSHFHTHTHSTPSTTQYHGIPYKRGECHLSPCYEIDTLPYHIMPYCDTIQNTQTTRFARTKRSPSKPHDMRLHSTWIRMRSPTLNTSCSPSPPLPLMEDEDAACCMLWRRISRYDCSTDETRHRKETGAKCEL